MTRIASLCSGYEGIGLGLAEALDIDLADSLAWHAEYDDAPARVHEYHFPSVPNYRDIKSICWPLCEPVDWLTAGYPCQPFSLAGKRKGADDPRHLWPYIAEAVRILRPGRVLLENVPGHLSSGFGTVLGDLAEIGYDARWVRLPASGVGAPHRRERVFILATDTDHAERWHQTMQQDAVWKGSTAYRPDGSKVQVSLQTALIHLLPTPTARDWKSGQASEATHAKNSRPLNEVVHLLPTPRASDGPNGGPNQRGSKGDYALSGAVIHLLPTPPNGETTHPRSSDGSASPDGEHPDMLSLILKEIGDTQRASVNG